MKFLSKYNWDKKFGANSTEIIMFQKRPPETVSLNLGKLKLNDKNSLSIQAISNNINYWEG